MSADEANEVDTNSSILREDGYSHDQNTSLHYYMELYLQKD